MTEDISILGKGMIISALSQYVKIVVLNLAESTPASWELKQLLASLSKGQDL